MFAVEDLPMVMLLSVVNSLVQVHPQNLTLINGYSGEFHCEGQVSDFLVWNDAVKGPPSLFAGVVGSTNIARGSDAGTGTKYENFFVDSPVGTVIFNMRIENAQFMDDEGMYECTTPAEAANPVGLSIEVPTDNISVSCDEACDGASEPTCVCTCIAEGGYPESLTLTWDIDQGSIVSDQLEKIERNGKYNFVGTASVMITQNEAVLQCSVQEYFNQAEIENDFSDQVIQEQTLSSSTDCILTLMETMPTPSSDCTVQLNCSCQGLPPINTCTFYNGTKDTVIPDKDSCSINHPVPFGTEVAFLCSGSNGINFQQDISNSVSYECRESTTISPPTTIDTTIDTTTATTLNDTKPDDATTPAAMSTKATPSTIPAEPESLSVVAIIFISLGGVAAVAAVGGGVYFVFFRGPSTSSKGNNSVRDGESDIVPANNEETNSSAPLYGVVNKDKKKKSDDNTDGNGKNSDPPEYAAVNKPLKNEPTAAPRSSAPSAGEEPEKMELQYADIDHGNKGPSFEIHQPADAPTEYATVQSVIV